MATKPQIIPGNLAPKEGPSQSYFDYLGPNGQKDRLDPRLQAKLRWLCQQFARRELYPRIWEIRAARKQRFFYRNIQHLLWNADEMNYQIDQASQGGVMGSSAAAKEPDLLQVFNIYLGYAKSFMSVFSQNAAGIRFEPEEPLSPIDIRAAKAAEKFKRILEKFNDPKTLQIEVARFLWTDGRVVAHTRYVTDGQRFGFENESYPDESSEGVQDQGEQIQQQQKIAKGREIIGVYGTLESKVPIATRDIHDWPYAQLSQEYDIAIEKAKYPWVADKLVAGAHGNEEELVARNARIGSAEGTQVLSQEGDSLAHLITEDKFWLRPAAFLSLPKSDPDRQELIERFPDGCYVVFAGGQYCESRNESMDDHLTVMHALPGDGQARPSLGSSEVPIQESFNEGMNLIEDYMRYGIPQKWVDQESVDIDAIQEQESAPGGYFPMSRKNGEPVGDHFWQEDPATMSPELPNWVQTLQGDLSQFITGQFPAVFGGEMSGAGGETAKGYQIAQAAAMGITGLTWMPFKQFYARTMLQAVRCAAVNRTADSVSATVQGKRGTEVVTVQIEDLKGNLLCFPDSDENFPESWTQKSNRYLALLGSPAAVAFMPILQHPDNLALAKDLIGLEDLVVPQQDSRDKQLEEIEQMLKEPPVPNVQALQMHAQITQMALQKTGQAPPPPDPNVAMQSSVEIDPIFDDHAAEFATLKEWVNSPDGQKAKQENPEGFQNVRLHGLAHFKQMAQQAAPPPPPPPMPMKPPAKGGTPGPPNPPSPLMGHSAPSLGTVQ